ncbi:MAG TPA: DEAD/DEAH box helicase [Longimicrobiales bacterium]|nr:DEAD/DEAH box helicase [Longimicrobiales bacterium]
MAPSHFHPIIARWWAEHFGPDSPPTPVQRRGWDAIRSGRDTLIAAPTGSGKTLAAFLHGLDTLLREGIERGERGLPDEVRILYVSPLKALSADIHRNLTEPLQGIERIAGEMGCPEVRITAAVRSGDTPASEREKTLRTPPHILVTTPESLFLLLTSARSREMLRTVRTVIVDEIHAVLESRRGAHLALTLERLAHVAKGSVQRIGLSATQRPIDYVAGFLGGSGAGAGVAIIDEGHLRELDLALELPESPLEAVMSSEVWEEVYDRLAALIQEHRTTLVFVNTRRLAERVTRHLSERLGADVVATHHGSLSKETRLDAEAKLKDGRLRALVATASLELGIDIGHVDLVCQLGSPRRIATFLQRVGRSGHTVGGTPRGRLFPLNRSELVECVALLDGVRRGELDRIVPQEAPLDVLAQQIVAEAAAEDWNEDDLFDLVRRAWPYRALERQAFDDVVAMLARGFTNRRARGGALLHRDAVNRRIRGRPAARLTALTAGGAIPEVSDYRVILEPEGTFLGTVNEDFAVESMVGDIFQLGNASWQVLRVQPGVLRVADAAGALPNIPFWFGEAPARSDEISAAVARVRERVENGTGPGLGLRPGLVGEGETIEESPSAVVSANATGRSVVGADDGAAGGPHDRDTAGFGGVSSTGHAANERLISPSPGPLSLVDELAIEFRIPREAASQLVDYLGESLRLLGALPTQRTLILERFFDDAGGMQLVLHAPFGARVNRAWGLALRKKFCRTFNFELQAVATDEGILLSLGPQHSFPLDEVWHYLRPETVRETLIQAVLDSPLFQTRWRWVTNLSLAVPRASGGRRVPPQIQRMQADDLLAAVFPDAAACLENVAGDREVPDHPLVLQALDDCLGEAMDLPALQRILAGIWRGELNLVARDLPEPSPLASQILSARVYEFLDDAPLEERRTQAVQARRAMEAGGAADLGVLDEAAIERVRTEAWPGADSADELHDALLGAGFVTAEEGERAGWRAWFDELAAGRRVAEVRVGGAHVFGDSDQRSGAGTESGAGAGAGIGSVIWVATERLNEVRAVVPGAAVQPKESVAAADALGPIPERHDALRELIRGRLEVLGPVTAAALGAPLGSTGDDVLPALVALEAEGVVLRGELSPGAKVLEWCDRRLLARIHRYTLDRLRAEIRPVTLAEYRRFLAGWQHVHPDHRVRGVEGLMAVIEQLDGFQAPARAWERHILPARVADYSPEMLDQLCMTGRVGWGRRRVTRVAGTLASTRRLRRGVPGRAGLAARNGRDSGEDAAAGSRRRRRGPRPVGTSPIALFVRSNADTWFAPPPTTSGNGEAPDARRAASLSTYARQLLEVLARRGASFYFELVAEAGILDTQAEAGLAELVAGGYATADSFAGLRALLVPGDKRPRRWNGSARRRRRVTFPGVDAAGRWSLLPAGRALAAELDRSTADDGRVTPQPGDAHRVISASADHIERWARTLLRRYGVVFRRVLEKETGVPPWRELARVYRRLEARGEIRGGHFVAGVSGEQFALPEAVAGLRAARRAGQDGHAIALSPADPLELDGLFAPGPRPFAAQSARVGVGA